MKKLTILTLLCVVFSFTSFSKVQVTSLLTENRVNPIGIDNVVPRFSWQLVSEERGISQTAYEIRLSESNSDLKKGRSLNWSSGKTISNQSVQVSYEGEEIQSGKRYYWQVRVWDQDGKASVWSEPAFFQMGFLDTSDWKAEWIELGTKDDTLASPLFRKKFELPKTVKSANMYITSQGLYEAMINGKRVGDGCLTPGWTSYNKRLQYQVYDVTSLLAQGANAIGVTLGNGWYKSELGWSGNRSIYKGDLALLLQLEITYTDGTSETVISDSNWKSSTSGPIRFAEVYHGETYDSRMELPGWSTAAFDDSKWENASEIDYSFNNLIATYNEPVRKHETFKAQKLIVTPEGDQVIDFGQNLVGWVQFKVSGNAGDSVKIFHSEVLDKDGNFYTESLRKAKQRNVYVLKGQGVETYEPRFSWQGFRFIKIVGYPGEVDLDNFQATALYSDMAPSGTFECSNDMLNQLQHNIQWGQRGNFLDVPTDCPQRDERLGWTGDAQAFARTATFNFRVNNFFAKWLKDVAVDQVDGSVPSVIPNILGDGGGSPGWGDAATIVPWTMYLAYGDKQILVDQFESMKAWVDHITRLSKDNLWIPEWSYGDWLFYSLTDDTSGKSAITDKSLIAQCFYAYSTQLVINAAKVLGKNEVAEKYNSQLKKIKDAFLREYVTPSGRMVSNTQTAYVLALQFDMFPVELREQAVQRLVKNIRDYQTHLTTGFLGTPYLCHVLSSFGHTDVAYELLLQKTYPSWLYPVTKGATTIWERWDGIKPDGSFQNPGMNSFNHYAYGAIGDWMYRVIAGLDTFEDAPGYKKISIKPHIGGGLTSASAKLKTYYGTASSSWNVVGGNLELEVEIPANTSAEVCIPADSPDLISESEAQLKTEKGVKVLESADGYVKVGLGSGKYSFIVKK